MKYILLYIFLTWVFVNNSQNILWRCSEGVTIKYEFLSFNDIYQTNTRWSIFKSNQIVCQISLSNFLLRKNHFFYCLWPPPFLSFCFVLMFSPKHTIYLKQITYQDSGAPWRYSAVVSSTHIPWLLCNSKFDRIGAEKERTDLNILHLKLCRFLLFIISFWETMSFYAIVKCNIISFHSLIFIVKFRGNK